MCKRVFLSICFLLVVTTGVATSMANDPHLMVWYKLDEASGTIAHDDSMYGRDAIVDGPPNWDPDDGRFGGSLVFNDDTDVEVPTSALSTISTGITVSLWLKNASRPGEDNWIFEAIGTGGSIVHAAVVAADGEALWRAGNSSSDVLRWDLKGRDPTIIRGWHHWVFVKDEIANYIRIYFDGELVLSSAAVDSTLANVQGAQLRFGVGSGHVNDFIGKMDEIRVYDWALPAQEVQWLYTGVSKTASAPDPEDQATDVPRDVILSWIPGEFADKHDVYLGTVFRDVNDANSSNQLGVLAEQGQYASTYDPERLDFDTTYYWRVDEVNAPPDSTIFQGGIWRFTTEPVGYPINGEKITATASSSGQANLGPENTINGSGLNENDQHSKEATDMWLSGNEPAGAWIQYEFDKLYKLHEMWIWNSNQVFESLFGFGMKDVTVEYSTDGSTWMALADVPQFAKAPGSGGYAHDTIVHFGGAVTKFVKLTATSNWGGVLDQFGLSEVRFFSIPMTAREPFPDEGAVGVNPAVILTWRAGREAGAHNLYLSADEQAVIDGTVPVVSVADNSYRANLDLAGTYYWRVDEINDIETPRTWPGDVWNFSTSEFLVVDDFESYNDYPSYEIYTTWVDGYEIPTNGSRVGNLSPPLAETTIIHGGNQSMPLFYSNTGGAAYSEAKRTFEVAQNWTQHRITTLSTWFRGTPGNTGQMYVKINNSKIPYNGAAANITLPGWQLWNIDLAASGLNLQNINSLILGIDGNGVSGTLYFDDIALYAVPPIPVVEVTINDDDDDVEERIGPNNGAMDMTSSDLEMPYEDSGQVDPQIVGLRFTGIAVPQGATVTDAWVQFTVDETKGGSDPVNLIIEGELSASTVGFSSAAGDISRRPKTAAKVQWSVPNWTNVGDNGPDQRTPNLASIIQEIVNQPSWTGEALVLMLRDDPANPSMGIRCAVAGPGTDAVLLHVDYQ